MFFPFSSRRNALWTIRSRHASAYVLSANRSYHALTGSCETTTVDLWLSLLSMTSKKSLHLSRQRQGNFIKKQGFPGSSVGKESTCNAGNPGVIPGLGRSTAEGIGYSLQYSWASLVAQLVKNLPAMQSLGWEDLLEKGKATHSSILAWRIP